MRLTLSLSAGGGDILDRLLQLLLLLLLESDGELAMSLHSSSFLLAVGGELGLENCCARSIKPAQEKNELFAGVSTVSTGRDRLG